MSPTLCTPVSASLFDVSPSEAAVGTPTFAPAVSSNDDVSAPTSEPKLSLIRDCVRVAVLRFATAFSLYGESSLPQAAQDG
jgi:hypothetical protein